MAVEAEPTLTTWRDRPHYHSIADRIPSDSRTDLVNASHRFMANDEAAFAGIFATQNVEIGSANRSKRYLNHDLAKSRFSNCHFFYSGLLWSVEYQCSHRVGGPPNSVSNL